MIASQGFLSFPQQQYSNHHHHQFINRSVDATGLTRGVRHSQPLNLILPGPSLDSDCIEEDGFQSETQEQRLDGYIKNLKDLPKEPVEGAAIRPFGRKRKERNALSLRPAAYPSLISERSFASMYPPAGGNENQS